MIKILAKTQNLDVQVTVSDCRFPARSLRQESHIRGRDEYDSPIVVLILNVNLVFDERQTYLESTEPV